MRQYRTLGDLRSDLSVRLGFGASGSAAITNKPILDSFLRDAQDQLAEQFNWIHLDRLTEIDVGVDQRYFDYPDDCDPENLRAVYVWNNHWYPLKEGVGAADPGYTGMPTRYTRRDQVEVWPVPTEVEMVRLEYTATLGDFFEDDDRASINDKLVFLHALANAKAHYRQPDAAQYQTQLGAALDKLKAKNRQTAVHTAHRTIDDDRLFLPSTPYQP